MGIPLSLKRRLLWRRRVAEARAWQKAERQRAAACSEVIRQILDQTAEASREGRAS
jgi:hypothetical protein